MTDIIPQITSILLVICGEIIEYSRYLLINNIIRTGIHINMHGFIENACLHCNFIKYINARVIPQPGQGSPVNMANGHIFLNISLFIIHAVPIGIISGEYLIISFFISSDIR